MRLGIGRGHGRRDRLTMVRLGALGCAAVLWASVAVQSHAADPGSSASGGGSLQSAGTSAGTSAQTSGSGGSPSGGAASKTSGSKTSGSGGGTASQGGSSSGGSSAGGGITATTGPQIYMQARCFVCHGQHGFGGVGPRFRNDRMLASAGYVVGQILIGRGVMPSFANTLSNQQIAAVATHIRTSWGNNFGPVTAAQVASTREQMSRVTSGGHGASTKQPKNAPATPHSPLPPGQPIPPNNLGESGNPQQ